MKVSLVTATFNSAKTVLDCIRSVKKQSYYDIEHIIIDGGSTDETIALIKSEPNRVKNIISESDNGIYDAMNKGIKVATGDIVGILNSDDFYTNSRIIEQVVKQFKTSKTECIFADTHFVKPDCLNKSVRYYSSKNFRPSKFRYGFMPAHPSFFTYKKNFDIFGYYKTDYKIAADFELLVRFLYVNKLSYKYLPIDMVTMRTGGASTSSIKSNFILNKEIVRACKENGVYTNLPIVLSKYFTKVFELIYTRNN